MIKNSELKGASTTRYTRSFQKFSQTDNHSLETRYLLFQKTWYNVVNRYLKEKQIWKEIYYERIREAWVITRDIDYQRLTSDSRRAWFDPIRNDERFNALAERVKNLI